jgi:hypothetical protein
MAAARSWRAETLSVLRRVNASTGNRPAVGTGQTALRRLVE